MNLNLDIISNYLPQSYQFQRLGARMKKVDLKCVLLYESNLEMEPGRLYVAHTSALPKAPPKSGLTVVCVGASPPREWLSSNCQILLVSGENNVYSVLNDIYMVFQKFSDWDCSLRDELEKEENIRLEKIMELGAIILENRIWVSVKKNESMRLLLSADVKIQSSGSPETTVKEVPGGMVFSINKGDSASDKLNFRQPYLSVDPRLGSRLYCYNFFLFGQYSGTLFLVECYHAFRDSDYPLAEHFFRCFEKAYKKYVQYSVPEKYPGNEEKIRSRTLKKLLDGTPLSGDENQTFAISEEWEWFFFRLKDSGAMKCLPIYHMNTMISSIIQDCISAVYDNSVVGLIKVSKDDNFIVTDRQDIKKWMVELGYDNCMDGLACMEKCLKETNYYAGLSDPFTDVTYIDIYKAQAEYALEAGCRMSKGARLFRFSSYKLHYMLSHCTGRFPVEVFFPKGLEKLTAHDEQSDASYIETLDSYLKNKLNLSVTASVLNLHRSSLMSRIERITKILNMDLEDPDVQLYLRICLLLIKSDQ